MILHSQHVRKVRPMPRSDLRETPIPNHLVLTASGCVNSLWQRNTLTSRIFGLSYSRYPDLSEAFEVWCFRSKAAKRRLNMESTVWVKVQVSNGSAKLHWICFHFSSKFLLKSRISLLANLLIELYKLGILFMVSFSFFASSFEWIFLWPSFLLAEMDRKIRIVIATS